jgi:hypothetical protein
MGQTVVLTAIWLENTGHSMYGYPPFFAFLVSHPRGTLSIFDLIVTIKGGLF